LDTTFKVKGQGHPAALVTAVLAARQLQRWAWERDGRAKLLLRCHLLGHTRPFSAHVGRRGAGHIVAAARLQLVIMCSAHQHKATGENTKRGVKLEVN